MTLIYYDNILYALYVKILQALKETDWNKAKAARLLGIDRRTIYRKIDKYKLSNPSD